MQNQGMIFAGEGPLMQGTWYNPQTGDSFTVRDSFFENNQYLVTTTDGRTLGYNQLQNYVKSDKPISVQKPATKKDNIPSEVEALIEGSDEDLLQEDKEALGNLYNKTNLNLAANPNSDYKTVILPNGGIALEKNNSLSAVINKNMFITANDNKNDYIIEKALSKTKIPELDFNIKWNKFPEREISMLVELMDISKEEIINWYIAQMNTETILDKMCESLKEFITNKINPQPVENKQKTTKKSKASNK